MMRVLMQETLSLIDLHNSARLNVGINPLAPDLTLIQTAEDKAIDMAQTGILNHISARLGSPVDQFEHAGLRFGSVGENIGRFLPGTPALVMLQAFLASPPHQENIMDPAFNAIGVSIIEDHERLRWVAVQFAGLL